MNEMTRISADQSDEFRAAFTTAEFLRMCDAGAFSGMNVELVQGRLERMPPLGNKHGFVQISLIAQLLASFGVERVRAEQAISLSSNTLVECDGAILRQPLREQPGILEPTDLLLVIEVAETTARRDLDQKRRLYAIAEIPNYWVADTKLSVTHVHSEPVEGEYKRVDIVAFGQPIPVPATDATIMID